MKHQSKKKDSDAQALILRKMGLVVYVKGAKVWLDTGSPSLNGVLGSRKYGLPAGRMWEIAGPKHSGKTAVVIWLAGLAQRLLNAFVVWIDAEGSMQSENGMKKRFQNAWAEKLGMDTSKKNFYVVYPKLLKFTKTFKKGKKLYKKGDSIIQPAEHLFEEAKRMIQLIKTQEPERPIVWVVDSIANLVPWENEEASFTNENMRTNSALSAFLSKSLKKMSNLGVNYDMFMFCINQIRTKPGVMFGDPTYTPGGNALEHNCHIQVRMGRANKLIIKEAGKTVEIGGKMRNIKNKAGGISTEGRQCLYHVRFKKHYDRMWKFNSVEE